jgi:hypothetical protein
MANIFQNSAKSVPKSDEQIVRVSMAEIEIQGRKSHLPGQSVSGVLGISHVPSSSATPGSK